MVSTMSHTHKHFRLFKWLFLLLFLCFCIFVFLFYAPQGFGEETTFTISGGEGVHRVSDNLKAAGLIRSKFIFETAVWLKQRGSRIQEGTFTLSTKMSVMKLVSVLSTSMGETVKVTVPEGYTLGEIFELFDAKGIASREAFETIKVSDFPEFTFLQKQKSFEGFMFPETHFFKTNSDPREVIATHLEEFQKRMIPIYEAGDKDRTLYDTLIMASIIEAEVPESRDRAIISGILWKRLDAGMPLQVDSTLNYAINGKRASLTAVELKKDSPYNTYLYPDLPPTPIGNPGESAMKAAVNPNDSPYWFFLSGKDGTTHFARDFEEHKRNKERYLR